jgi:hypothetical protein
LDPLFFVKVPLVTIGYVNKNVMECYRLIKNGQTVQLKCIKCSHKYCHHLNLAVDPLPADAYPLEADQVIENEEIELHSNESNLISQLPYCFQLAMMPELERVVRARLLNGLEWWNDNFPNRIISEIQCQCNSSNQSTSRIYSNVQIYTLTFSLSNYKIIEKNCNDCGRCIPFDGNKFGLLNYKNQMLFAVEFMYELLYFKAYNGLPTYTFWKTKIDLYVLSDNIHLPVVERYRWKKRKENYAGLVNQIFVSFCKLLDIPNDLFKCCDEPEMINIDGIVLSIETSRVKQQALNDPFIIIQQEIRRGSSRAQRSVYDYNESDRQLLHKYVASGLSDNEWDAFLQVQIEPMKSFLCHSNWRMAILAMGVNYCKEDYCDFILSLTKNINPSIQFFPAIVWSAWDAYWTDLTKIYDLQRLLKRYAPCFSKLFNYSHFARESGNPIESQSITALLEYIVENSRSMYNAVIDNYSHIVDFNDRSGDSRYESGKYFPGRPSIRTIHLNSISNSNAMETACSKYGKQNTKLNGGIILYWCAEHRCCIGWNMVENMESPKDVYCVLSTRFKKIPKVV